ncbi:UPF0160 protein MYG1, mitochondrial-like protein [Euroglyphus maynei]|uniref:UPF0160 protein MYG1, mitochondrial-like protein n=1 Tax=Euroglyphus maynei TaxID=6958 RepID=A0A1Y3BP52_EURMA|nr:UPF0160 protein MYG1, mitochondrial-like protein [Euroglyphus maynei]
MLNTCKTALKSHLSKAQKHLFTTYRSQNSVLINRKSFVPMSTDNSMKIIKIGTHNGAFHCDESLACFMIKKLPSFENGTIIRSREMNELNSCDIVVDVGGIYDPDSKRFDHHQKTFDKTLSDIFPGKNPKIGNVKLSSAGLIYAHYGHEILARILDWNKDEQRTDIVFDMVYENFVKEIDAIDNGINMYQGEPIYHIHTNLSQRVANLKPRWNEEETPEILYERFLKAVELAGQEFVECVNYYGHSWFPARQIVMEAFDKRFENDPSGRIILFNVALPWIQHLFQIESENNVEGQIAFAIFPDHDSWRIRAVPVSESSFELRNPLKAEWRGLSSAEICRLSNINDCVFVHSTGFIGGNKTIDGALQMARESLQHKKIKNHDD